jgi:hypothetical protein
MSPHEITQLLEPSNLLEPLDLTEQRTGFANPSPGIETGAGAQRLRPRETVGMRPPSGIERRSGFKSILVVAVAVTCFGAGTLLPQLQNLAREALGLGGANPSLPAAPLADAAAKSEVSNSSSASQPDTPLNAAAAALPTADFTEGNSSAVAHSSEPLPTTQPATNDVSVGCAGPCNQQSCPPSDANCLEGGAPTRAKPLTNADGSAADPAKVPPRAAAKSQSAESERADTRTMSRQDERAHSSRPSKRATQHERGDQQAVAKRGAATASRSSRRQNANQPSFWRRDMASGDSMPTSSWWQRDRYDDYPRDRSRLRTGRDDDFLMGARWRW